MALFDYARLNDDLMLTTNEAGTLCVNTATIAGDSFVDFVAKSDKLIGTIVLEQDDIRLNLVEQA